MKRISAFLLAFVFLSFMVLSASAQTPEDWEDPYTVFLDHPGIISGAMSRVGITANTDDSYPGMHTKGEQCESPYSFDAEARYWLDHEDYVYFLTESDPDSYVSTMLNDTQDYYQLISSSDYYERGIHFKTWTFKIVPGELNYGYQSYGYAQLDQKYGDWFGFVVSETCTDSFGVHLPSVGSLMTSFFNACLENGYLSTVPTAQFTPTVSPTPDIYEAPIIIIEQTPTPEPLSPGQTTPPQAKSVAPVIISAAAGAVIGSTVILLAGGRKRLPVTMVQSPVDGTLVSAKQAQFEQNQLDAGLTFNPAKNGFEYIPQAEKTFTPVKSALQNDLDAINAKHKAEIQALKQQAMARTRARYQEQMNAYQKDYEKHMKDVQFYDRAIVVATLIEKTADIAVEVIATVSSGGGYQVYKGVKALKSTYDIVKDGFKFFNTTADKGVVEGLKEYALGKARDKAVDNLPLPKFKKHGKNSVFDALGNALTTDVAKTGVEKGAEYTKEGVKYLGGKALEKLQPYIDLNSVMKPIDGVKI